MKRAPRGSTPDPATRAKAPARAATGAGVSASRRKAAAVRHRRALAVPNNLPLAVSTFVGRGPDIDKTLELLGTARLVTLSGGPGVGKTRLATEVADRASGGYPDGVWLASLAPVSEPDQVAKAAAGVLRVREQPGLKVTESVAAGVGSQRLLLVLDNCEHVVGACADLVTALLAECPNLTVLATSQEPLGIPGEHVWLINGLPVAGKAHTKVEADAHAAVDLFAERAAAANSQFELTDEVRPAVEEVCRRLDGIPLAIELAAARVAMFSPADIARRLDDRFVFLVQGNRAALQRHRTLKAAVDWSYELLSGSEQALLRRLAVFAGGFTMDAVDEICSGGDVDGADCVELIARLVSRSLVCAEADPDGTRYHLLETIRDYGRERLIAAGEAASTSARHLGWCLALAERAEAELTGPSQHTWLDRLETEHDNMRAALRWSLSEARTEEALRLAGALTLFWRMRGHFSEGRDWLDQVLAAEGVEAFGPLLGRALWGKGLLAAMVGDYGSAAAAGRDSLELWRELGDRQGGARSLLLLGTCALVQSGPDAGVPILRQSIALAGEVGDSWCRAHALALCGSSFNQQGDIAAARPMLEECVREARNASDDQCLAFGLNGLGYIALCEGSFGTAAENLKESLEVARSTGGSYETASALSDLAQLALGRGDLDEARNLVDEALVIARQAGSTDALVYSTEILGRIAQAEGDVDAAGRLFTEGLRLARASRGTSTVALQGLGEVKLARGDLSTARSLLEEARELATDCGHTGRTAAALSALGHLARADGDLTQATSLHHRALGLRAEIGDRPGVVESFEALASLAAGAGRGEQAVRVFGAADALRSRHGYARSPSSQADYDRDVASCRDALGDEQFEALWAEGQALSISQAVSYVSKGRGTRSERPVTGWEALTPAEKEVATQAAHGLTNAQIGEKLFVSGNTVKSHLARVFAKLKVTSRRELTRRMMIGADTEPLQK